MCNSDAPITCTPLRCLRCPPPCCDPCISYCIFDLESAVFDTRHIYQRACRDLVASYNKSLPDEVLMCCGPMETNEMAEFICRKCRLPIQWEIFLLQLNEYTCKLIADPPIMLGAERLINHLHENCIGLGLITSSTKELYCKKIIGQEELFDKFTHVLCSDEYNRHKPDPDCYMIVMSMFCEKPCSECVLAFDGTVKGVQAARDAHLRVIMLPDPELPCCWSELATKRFETLIEFDPEEFGMPPLPPLPPEPSPIPSRRGSNISKQSEEQEEVDEEEQPEGEGQEDATPKPEE